MRYTSHKVVNAWKIQAIDCARPDGTMLSFDDGTQHLATKTWDERFAPVAGQYFVRYPDDYESVSPAEAFEAGYVRADQPTFTINASDPAAAATVRYWADRQPLDTFQKGMNLATEMDTWRRENHL